ncbi:TetR/AcrR family transcriptional regulator [Proteus cibi]|uniref:TetR/AcrR family transcriptional regulator n=1 Tax=Proteus cibi TaxID=2050966 RepID=A0ABU6EBE2_9GAMM|nr:TetR/AcrR family transcriptional regulator [Proteus cibi]EST58704.1 DNA-binding transcriptional repressor AcrR [Proteus hauseri ZMd44]MEB6856232.1 TetR/AcrR family transcriptional regulator [Proteus cibi]MEB7087775.1 TetR/AcrR family transcriptional regulator [Proteus cibi]
MNKTVTEKQKAKKKHIIDAAIRCFAVKGFHSTSTAEICHEAGMSPGNVFHYFPNKNSIIEAIALEDTQLFDEIFCRYEGEEECVQAIINSMKEIIALYNHPEYARISIEIFAEASRNASIHQIFIENERNNKQRLIAMLKNGIKKGQIDPTLEPEKIATWLLVIADGSMGRNIIDPEFNGDEDFVMLDVMLRKMLTKP